VTLVAETTSAILPFVRSLTLIGVVTGTAKSFEWLEGSLNDEGKQAISRWLRNEPSTSRFASWNDALSSLIDKVFGPNAFSWRFFRRSLLATFIALSVVTLIRCGRSAVTNGGSHFEYVWYVLLWILRMGLVNSFLNYVSLGRVHAMGVDFC